MNVLTAEQFAATFAEAAVAFNETGIPQAMIWIEDEQRWDFVVGDEDLTLFDVVFILQTGWDGRFNLENTIDINDDNYNAFALTAEVAQLMADEGYARMFIEKIIEHRDRLAAGEDESEVEAQAIQNANRHSPDVDA